MIGPAQLRQIRYGIEQLPDSWYGVVPLGGEPAPAVLDLRKFSPQILRLVGIEVTANAAVTLRARYDQTRIEENTAAMLTLFPGAWDLLAKDQLYLNLFGNVGAPVANYPVFYSLWVIQQTIAHKLLLGINLTPDEKVLADKLSLSDLVQKGLAPFPLRYQIEREYAVMAEETHARTITIAAANTVYNIENLYPRPGEILVLTRIAGLDAAPANVTRLTIGRDDDVGLADVFVFPLRLIPGGEVSCFIPVIRELRLTCQAALIAGAIPFRYTFQRIKLNNILRARLGLATKDELPGDVYDKVMAGVL
jgi:hypothetical protein